MAERFFNYLTPAEVDAAAQLLLREVDCVEEAPLLYNAIGTLRDQSLRAIVLQRKLNAIGLDIMAEWLVGGTTTAGKKDWAEYVKSQKDA